MNEDEAQANASRAGRCFRSWATTHNGTVRSYNEDHYVNRPDLGLWAVADGAGGHSNGARASALVAGGLEGIASGLSGPDLLAEARDRIADSHRILREEAGAIGADAVIATTVVVLLASHNHYACLWAGDSRAYLLRQGRLSQVTRDHSLVQELVDAGAITAAEAECHPRANVITRAVGVDAETVDLDKATDRLMAGDRFLLCSDGLNKSLDDATLAAALTEAGGTPACERLIAAALARGATDNITALVVDFEPEAEVPA